MAVDEWLESGKMFHVMRDHPGHNMHILCGMWGARWDLLIHPSNGNFSSLRRRRPFSPRLLTAEDLMKIRNKMLKMAYKDLYVGLDQIILKVRNIRIKKKKKYSLSQGNAWLRNMHIPS